MAEGNTYYLHVFKQLETTEKERLRIFHNFVKNISHSLNFHDKPMLQRRHLLENVWKYFILEWTCSDGQVCWLCHHWYSRQATQGKIFSGGSRGALWTPSFRFDNFFRRKGFYLGSSLTPPHHNGKYWIWAWHCINFSRNAVNVISILYKFTLIQSYPGINRFLTNI